MVNKYTRRYSALFYIFQPVQIIVMAFIFYPTRPEILFLSGAISIFVYSFLILDEYYASNIRISPFLFYLCLSWIRIGVVPIYLACALSLGYEKDLNFAGNYVIPFLIPGLFIETLGDWFFIAGYYYLRKYASSITIPKDKDPCIDYRRILRGAFVIISFTYGGRIANWCGLPMHMLGEPYNVLRAYGVPAGIMMAFYAIDKVPLSKRLTLIIVTLVLFVLELSMAMSSYMKEGVIVAMLPLCIYFAERLHKAHISSRIKISFIQLVIFGTLGLFCVSVLFNYSEMRRPEYWDSFGMTTKTPPIVKFFVDAVKSSIPGTDEFHIMQRFPTKGVWAFVSRNNFVSPDGWGYEYVQRNGTNDAKWLKEVPSILIPRFLWPEKPLISYGRELAVLMGAANSWESSTTAIGFSMSGCLYFGYGWILLVSGMFFNGILFFFFWKVFSRTIYINPIATMICVSLYVMGIRWHEGAFDGNAVQYALLIILFLPLSWRYNQSLLSSQRKSNFAIITKRHAL